MKNLFSFLVIGCLGIFGLTACSGDVSVNTVANTGRTTANTASNMMSSVGNAANSVANAVSGATTSSPESFMKDACQGGMAEVEMGKLAEQKSKNPEIKKFGQMMVTDHTAAGNDLKALAAKKNITLPTDLGSHKSTMDSLSKETDGFDKAYVNEMVSDHEADLKEFQKQAQNSSDPDVKAFAAKVVPVIQKHLDAIKAIEAKMK
jgi:putative membrane protein